MSSTETFLASLIGFATESRAPNHELQRWIADRVEELGGRPTFIEGPAGRATLLASFGPDAPGGLLLAAHTDVVPAGSGWATNPYALTEREGCFFGRGTADMKGFIAATLCVLQRVTDVRAPLHLALSFDEEIGCAGMPTMLAYLAEHTTVAPELVLIGEPTMMIPRHRHLGKVAFEVTFRGISGHSSRSPEVPSTLTSAARVALALEALQDAYRSPDDAGGYQVTVNCGAIHGGTAVNVIADRCDLSFELRHTPELDPDQLLAPVLQTLASQGQLLEAVGGGVDIHEVTRYPGLATDTSHPLVTLVERIADAGRCQSIGFGTEGGLYGQALEVPTLICGPGDIAVAHRPDEYVSREQLHRCEGFLKTLIETLCCSPATADGP